MKDRSPSTTPRKDWAVLTQDWNIERPITPYYATKSLGYSDVGVPMNVSVLKCGSVVVMEKMSSVDAALSLRRGIVESTVSKMITPLT